MKKEKNALVFWFTGLSGSGKSTIVSQLLPILSSQFLIKVVDGDEIRNTLHRHLGFSHQDIVANNKLIIDYCQKNSNNFDLILVPVIAPFEKTRISARKILGKKYYEIYVKADLETCKKRDVKGLYQKALAGEIKNFIGVDKSTPYQIPQNADLVVDTEKYSIDQAVEKTRQFILEKLKRYEK